MAADSGASGGPRDAAVMEAILKEMGVEEYEPNVVHQMLEFSYREYDHNYLCMVWHLVPTDWLFHHMAWIHVIYDLSHYCSDSRRMSLVCKCVCIFGLWFNWNDVIKFETKLTPGDSVVNFLSVECWTNQNGWEPLLRLRIFSLWKFVHKRLIPRITSVLLNRLIMTRNYRRCRSDMGTPAPTPPFR